MRISEHADRSEKLVGLRAEDIHKWIDDLFDAEGFDQLLRLGRSPDYDPYDHRKFRHCQEAIKDACDEFAGKYTPEQVRAVFECHIRDDYDGYLPHREDFENGTFTEKYHDSEEQAKAERILNPAELSEYFKGQAYSQHQLHAKRLGTGFRLRIILPTLATIVLFVTSVFAFVIPAFRSTMLDGKKTMVRELTSAAVSVVESYAQQEQQGKLSKNKAQELAAAKVRAMRYGAKGKDYFWITDMHPMMVMHPYRPDLVGADLESYTDTKGQGGKKLFVEAVHIVRKQGAGYMEYLWQWKDDPSRTGPKLSYVRGVPSWGWIIGTGIYLDDVQTEIDRLTRNLSTLFILIGAALAIMLLSVVLQSRKISEERISAQMGLHEAKERYRALVDASKEGYILDIEGECIYSNRTLQRMLGLSAEELAARKVWDLLVPGAPANESAREHLMKLSDGEARASSFPAQLAAGSGGVVDVMVSISKIFFSQKNGHVISFRLVRRTRVRSLLESFVDASSQREEGAGVLKELEESKSVGQIVETLNRLSLLVREMADQGVRPGLLRHTIGETFDASVASLMKMALKEVGKAPVPFAFLALGSNARHEMTMFSDQDNALVFADVSPGKKEDVTKYFLELSDHVCSNLNEVGYPYCPGGIMAVNPQWCMPLSAWKSRFGEWVNNATPKSILEFNVFFDIHCIYGEQEIADALTEHIHDLTEDNTTFFMHFSRNCLLYKAPLDLLSKRRVDKKRTAKKRAEQEENPGTINIKECLKPVEIFVRVHALKHRVIERSTLGRLMKLGEMGALPQGIIDESVYIFNYLWRMRFYNQLLSHADLKQVNDSFDLGMLTEVERQNLHNVLSRLRVLQQKLCSEFLGMPLHMMPSE
ncbi:MAG: cache domain-containing protein [Deltaproteobacteria bacterium]|nr:cache domain-containing protein [Deltaproteobacteria bacterium]